MGTTFNSDNELISVIIPAYKSENSIEKCVRSVQDQSHKSIEIIVVNDCSPDDTGEIVKVLARSDARIKLITPLENVGVHGARRLGFIASSGAYIGFVDADDYVEPTMYAALYGLLVEHGSSIAICSAALVHNGKRLPTLRVGLRRSEVVRTDPLSKFCRLKFGSGVLWNKLYERSIIEASALFELERAVDMSEDYIVNFGAFANAKAVSLCADPLYNFVAHSSSGSAPKGWLTFARILRAYVVCLERYAVERPELSRHIDQLFLKQLHFNEYRIPAAVQPPPEAAVHVATSLRRLADVSPTSVYSILHALPSKYSRLDRVLSGVRQWRRASVPA